ncbi:hypothetical protein J6590_014218 [Homalodisca vitripennis]|nr:hypothetical protein J6590_014218 [Homalodisca vitripennis]
MCVLIGDINIDLLKNEALTDKYMNCLLGTGLVKCVDKPTRVTENTQSCLDHIFVRYRDMSRVRAAVVETILTDYYSTVLTITGPTATIKTQTDTATDVDRMLLADNLTRTHWEPVLEFLEVNTCSTLFNDIEQKSIENATKLSNKISTRSKKLGYLWD